MDRQYCVYMHISPSDKAYIGITSMDPYERWSNGYGYFKKTKNGNYHQPAMVNAINKYGWENFEHILFEIGLSKSEAEHMEKILIALWKTNNPKFGYNIRNGGGSIGILSEETKKKMSEAHKGIHHTDETKMKLSYANGGANHWLYGGHHSEETRKKMSESQKRIPRQKDNILKAVDACKKSIICIELNLTFDSIANASRVLNIPRTTINAHLAGRLTHAGKHPDTDEDLHWQYT